MSDDNSVTKPKLFEKGGPPGPGNPIFGKLLSYRQMIANKVSVDEFGQLIDQALIRLKNPQCKDKDFFAGLKLLIERFLGKPQQNIDVSVSHTQQMDLSQLPPAALAEFRQLLLKYHQPSEPEIVIDQPHHHQDNGQQLPQD